MRVLGFEPLRRNSLCGLAKIQFGSGLVVSDVTIHQLGGRMWASPPGRPMIDAVGRVMPDNDGKIPYAPIVSFMNRGTPSSWSRQVAEMAA